MIRQTYKDNQARYIRNDNNKKTKQYFSPDQLQQEEPQQIDLHKYDHLVPPMKKALKFTAKATWFMMKTLVKAAFKIPRLFSQTAPKPSPKKNPSPSTAFPAP
jgi:hypothetical protein